MDVAVARLIEELVDIPIGRHRDTLDMTTSTFFDWPKNLIQTVYYEWIGIDLGSWSAMDIAFSSPDHRDQFLLILESFHERSFHCKKLKNTILSLSIKKEGNPFFSFCQWASNHHLQLKTFPLSVTALSHFHGMASSPLRGIRGVELYSSSTAMAVNPHILAVLLKAFPDAVYFRFLDGCDMNDVALKTFLHTPHRQNLPLKGLDVRSSNRITSQALLEVIEKAGKGLEELAAMAFRSDEELHLLASSCHHLRKLKLSVVDLTVDGVALVLQKNHKTIENLTFYLPAGEDAPQHCPATADLIRTVASICGNLKSLRIEYCRGPPVTAALIKELTNKCPHLSFFSLFPMTVDLSSCTWTMQEGHESYLREMLLSNLRLKHLRGATVNSSDLRLLAGHAFIEDLVEFKATLAPDVVSDDLLALLSRVPNLRFLSLKNGQIFNDAHLLRLHDNTPKLSVMEVQGSLTSCMSIQCRDIRKTLEAKLFKGVPGKSLGIFLAHCNWTSDVLLLGVAESFPTLKEVHIEGTDLTDDGLLKLFLGKKSSDEVTEEDREAFMLDLKRRGARPPTHLLLT